MGYPRLGTGYTYPSSKGKRRTWNLPRWLSLSLAIVVASLILSRPLHPQQQVSGGGAVTLSAGSNIVGKVGIDQTTPGTTNLVSIGSNGTVALSAGAAVNGHVINDASSAGTGHVIADSGST